MDQIPEEADKGNELVSSACKLRFPDKQKTSNCRQNFFFSLSSLVLDPLIDRSHHEEEGN